ncbi:MAG: HlyC/CorC family transporter, partial [Hyphomicrobiaceae bacterium]|nr:HlyC/CorC family transporter [Hyphomicrobiaceae bacterium]
VLLGNNLVNILASALTTSLLISLFGEAGVFYATIIMTLLVVIFCEVLPKTYAIVAPDHFSLAIAPLMRLLIATLYPFTIIIDYIVRKILSLIPIRSNNEANILAAYELRGTIELSTREGTVDKGEAQQLGGVLDLKELKLDDIMVHRTKMETINAVDTPRKVVEDVLRSQYTRMPIWEGQPDNITGMLHSKDLLTELGRCNWETDRLDISKIASKPWFVPDTTSVSDQLSAFQDSKSQMALVVDEYGEVQGLITLEDILEEIVGQITDEHDVGDISIRPQADGTVNVDGGVAVRDVNREMDWDLPDDQAVTIAGLVIHEAQLIPEPGQAFTFYGYRFEILRKSRNRITALRVQPVESLKFSETCNGYINHEDKNDSQVST